MGSQTRGGSRGGSGGSMKDSPVSALVLGAGGVGRAGGTSEAPWLQDEGGIGCRGVA